MNLRRRRFVLVMATLAAGLLLLLCLSRGLIRPGTSQVVVELPSATPVAPAHDSLAQSSLPNDSIDPVTLDLPGGIRGQVYRVNGSLAAGARVGAVHVQRDFSITPAAHDPVVVTTDGEGAFVLESLPLGSYVLQAALEGESAQERCLLLADSPIADCVILLHTSELIAGTVFDSAGAPVGGATLRPLLHNGKSIFQELTRGGGVRSEMDGTFAFAYLETGEWTIEVVADGFAPTLTPAIPTGTSDVQIHLSRGLAIAGTVTLDGSPVEGARVVLARDASPSPEVVVSSGADGSFHFSAAGSGEYLLGAENDGLVVSDSPLRLKMSNSSIMDLDLSLVPGGIVRGRVRDQETGEGISGVEVAAVLQLDKRFRRTSKLSGVDGRYEINGLTLGAYSLRPSRAPGFANVGGSRNFPAVEVAPGMVREGVDISLLRGIGASGRVLDVNGDPVAGAVVQGFGQGWQDTQTSNADGTYTLSNIKPGCRITLQAMASCGASPVHGPVLVPPEGLKGIDLVLSEARSCLVSGRIVDLRNRPVIARIVALSRGKGHVSLPVSTNSGRDGRFVLPNIVPGTYELAATPGDGERQLLIELTLKSGQEVRDLLLIYEHEELLELSGVVQNERGLPVVGALVSLMEELVADEYQTQAATRSGPGGVFKFTGLSPGQYRISGGATDYTDSEPQIVMAGEKDVVISIVGMARVHGVVVDTGGKPVPSFEVAAVGRGVVPGSFDALQASWLQFANERGEFELTVDGGSQDIVARANGYAVGRAHPPAIQPGEVREGVVVVLTPREPTRGRVVNMLGEGVGGAFVFNGPLPNNALVMASSAPATTDSRGYFELSAPEPGQTVHLSAAHPTEGAGEAEFDSQSGLIEITLLPPSDLSVFVTFDGRPVPGAIVLFTCKSGTRLATADESGYSVFHDLPFGEGTLTAKSSDGLLTSLPHQVVLFDGHETSVDLVLE